MRKCNLKDPLDEVLKAGSLFLEFLFHGSLDCESIVNIPFVRGAQGGRPLDVYTVALMTGTSR